MCYRGRLRATTDFLSDDGVRALDGLRGVYVPVAAPDRSWTAAALILYFPPV